MTTLFETADVEAAHHILSNLYGIRHFATPADNPFLRIRRDILGPAQLHHLTFKMSCEAEGDPLGMLYFGQVIDGSFSRHHGRDNHTYVTGDVFLACHDLPTRVSINAVEVDSVGLEPAVLAKVADADPVRSPNQIRFTAYQPANPHDAKLWLDTYSFVRQTFDGQISAMPPLLLANMSRLLAATALVAFPNNALLDPAVEDRHDAHPRTVRRAVSFIEGNAHRDICPADVAAAAHVTIRALQLAFRRHLDTTPTAYLRSVRLEYAHRELVAANPYTTSVGDVAARWGFASHSRFTAHYRMAYGTTPSETLQRR